MIEVRDLRIGNVIWDDRREKAKHVNHRVINDLASNNNPLPYSPLAITKEILKFNLGFEVTDFGEYWEFLLDEFILMQPKMQLVKGIEMPFIFAYKTVVPKTIPLKYVHQLQNLYQALHEKELTWKEPSTSKS